MLLLPKGLSGRWADSWNSLLHLLWIQEFLTQWSLGCVTSTDFKFVLHLGQSLCLQPPFQVPQQPVTTCGDTDTCT